MEGESESGEQASEHAQEERRTRVSERASGGVDAVDQRGVRPHSTILESHRQGLGLQAVSSECASH
eukprot:4704987-Pleurochrysis_carterae.AAC.2